MKSPNAKLSVSQIELSIKLLKNAREDLKNSVKVRDLEIHNEMEKIETKLASLVTTLKALGFNK